MDVDVDVDVSRCGRYRAFEGWEDRYGLQIEAKEEIHHPKIWWKPLSEIYLQVAQSLASRLPLASDGQPGVSREQYQIWYEEAVEEFKNGVGIILKSHFDLVARKVS